LSIQRNSPDALRQLAERYGIIPVYQAKNRTTVRVPQETIFSALRALGLDISSLDEVSDAYAARRAADWSAMSDPTATAWDGAGQIEVRLPSRHSTTELHLRLLLEEGDELAETVSLRDFKVTGSARLEATASTLARAVTLPWEIPPGYHQLELESGERRSTTIILSAPRRAFQHERDRSWGVFLPLYSLQTQDSWGAGNYGDLGRLLDWTAERGGSYTGTLPLLPAFLDEPFLPSPYAPVSRLFWNEFYLDIPAIPEFSNSDEARQLVDSTEFQQTIAQLRSGDLVQYREGMRLRRSVLELLAAEIESRDGDRYADFQAWLDDHRHARLYAIFRALVERHGTVPSGWPVRIRPEHAADADYDQSAFNYHAYVQWIADQQIRSLPQLPDSNAGLYLDLPIGVHGDGYDAWREDDLFARGFSVGAPPDRLGPDGQNWGFPPLNPVVLREQGHRHFIEVIQHHMRYASLLRVDHIMGLHRLFWIPAGAEAKDGVYVQYPADDLYAILSLESHRHQTEIVGEDLGTVPHYVRPAMEEHAINRMIIVPFEVEEDADSLNEIPEESLTALNTHDLPPLAGLYQSWFDEGRQDQLAQFLAARGLISDATKPDDLEAIIPATIEFIGSSDARIALANLEDLWLERASQNVPGTLDDEHPNWRRKAAKSFEEFSDSSQILGVLENMNKARQNPNTMNEDQ
jgi:4-alpha-glucanotransferase